MEFWERHATVKAQRQNSQPRAGASGVRSPLSRGTASRHHRQSSDWGVSDAMQLLEDVEDRRAFHEDYELREELNERLDRDQRRRSRNRARHDAIKREVEVMKRNASARVQPVPSGSVAAANMPRPNPGDLRRLLRTGRAIRLGAQLAADLAPGLAMEMLWRWAANEIWEETLRKGGHMDHGLPSGSWIPSGFRHTSTWPGKPPDPSAASWRPHGPITSYFLGTAAAVTTQVLSGSQSGRTGVWPPASFNNTLGGIALMRAGSLIGNYYRRFGFTRYVAAGTSVPLSGMTLPRYKSEPRVFDDPFPKPLTPTQPVKRPGWKPRVEATNGDPRPPYIKRRVIPSGHQFRRKKDHKLSIRNAGMASKVLKAFEALSEGKDAVNAIYESLPKRLLRQLYAELGRQPRPQEKLLFLLKHFTEINWALAIKELVTNQLEDNFYGRIDGGKRLNQLSGGLTGGSRALNHGDPNNDPFGALEDRFYEKLEDVTGKPRGTYSHGGLERRLRGPLDR